MINSLIRLIGSLIAFGLITANGYSQKKPRMIKHNVLMNGVEWVSPDGKWLVQRVDQYDLQLLDRSTGSVEHEFTSRGFHEQKFQLGRFTSDSKAFVLIAGTGNNFSELDITRYDIPQKEVRTGTAHIFEGY